MSAAQNDTLNHASRRDVLKAAAALTVAFWLPRGAGATPTSVDWRGGFGVGTERIRAHRR